MSGADVRHAVFDGLGDEIWRQYLDLDSQNHGQMAYDRGLGHAALEPGPPAAAESAAEMQRSG